MRSLKYDTDKPMCKKKQLTDREQSYGPQGKNSERHGAEVWDPNQQRMGELSQSTGNHVHCKSQWERIRLNRCPSKLWKRAHSGRELREKD